MDRTEGALTSVAGIGIAGAAMIGGLPIVAGIVACGSVAIAGYSFAGNANRDHTKRVFPRPKEAPKGLLPFYVGRNEKGRIMHADLATCPHLRIAGPTGSGKSTLLYATIEGWIDWIKPKRAGKPLFVISSLGVTHWMGEIILRRRLEKKQDQETAEFVLRLWDVGSRMVTWTMTGYFVYKNLIYPLIQ